jgi:hypothetical protein
MVTPCSSNSSVQRKRAHTPAITTFKEKSLDRQHLKNRIYEWTYDFPVSPQLNYRNDGVPVWMKDHLSHGAEDRHAVDHTPETRRHDIISNRENWNFVGTHLRKTAEIANKQE